jgi:hypothetical protein
MPGSCCRAFPFSRYASQLSPHTPALLSCETPWHKSSPLGVTSPHPDRVLCPAGRPGLGVAPPGVRGGTSDDDSGELPVILCRWRCVAGSAKWLVNQWRRLGHVPCPRTAGVRSELPGCAAGGAGSAVATAAASTWSRIPRTRPPVQPSRLAHSIRSSSLPGQGACGRRRVHSSSASGAETDRSSSVLTARSDRCRRGSTAGGSAGW